MDKQRTVEDAIDKANPWQLAEIVDPANCRLVTMPDNADSTHKVCYMFKIFFSGIIFHMHQFLHRNRTLQVVRLLYTNSGVGLLALGSNGIQKLWKWTRNEQNPSGKVLARKLLTTYVDFYQSLVIIFADILVSVAIPSLFFCLFGRHLY